MAVVLVKEGASDYIAKPWDDDKLVASVKNLLGLRALRQENTRFRAKDARRRSELLERYDLCGMVYESREMHDVVSLAVHVAPSDVPVLITGPNGSGKEKLAEIVQANSRRQGKPFVKVNAGGLPDQLLEAELFGAEPGAFTGANKLRIGRFEAAHGGTLFLDEIGNLTASGQMKLLRVLQTGEFERLGSSATRKVDVRIVSATNADLRADIAAGKFREDLYFRLNVIELAVPALADRIDDVRSLAGHFIGIHKGQAASADAKLGSEAMAALEQHDWPGNVRELENRVQRALLVCREGVITPKDLGLEPNPSAARARSVPPPRPEAPSAGDGERQTVEAALLRARGVVSQAAAELGLSRQALYRRMERLGIEIERRPRAS
jgi:DNA-binding NtrC family response regulator